MFCVRERKNPETQREKKKKNIEEIKHKFNYVKIIN